MQFERQMQTGIYSRANSTHHMASIRIVRSRMATGLRGAHHISPFFPPLKNASPSDREEDRRTLSMRATFIHEINLTRASQLQHAGWHTHGYQPVNFLRRCLTCRLQTGSSDHSLQTCKDDSSPACGLSCVASVVRRGTNYDGPLWRR
jgi:hypothetical protein